MKFNFLKTKKTFRKAQIMRSPHFFWMLVLGMMAVVIIGSFIFGVVLFMKVNKEPVIAQDDSSGQVETVNQEQLKHTLQYFYDRENKLNSIINSPSPVVDPSL